jgi:hypothetical protein
MTPAERREANRLRSERWRRRYGIMPRKPASKPWLAMNISRSTYYRRRAKAANAACFASCWTAFTLLTRDLARVDICVREMGAIIAELAA